MPREATALVPIGHALHVSVGQTAVLVSVLYVASSIAQPTAGRLAEHFGPRRALLAGAAMESARSRSAASQAPGRVAVWRSMACSPGIGSP